MAPNTAATAPLGIICSCHPRALSNMQFVECPINLSDNTILWSHLPLTIKLGVPLRYTVVVDGTGRAMPTEPQQNKILATLAHDIDPNSRTFMKHVVAANHDVIISRADHVSITREQFQTILNVVNGHYRRLMPNLNTTIDKEKIWAGMKSFAAFITAENFVAYFETVRGNVAGMDAVECPVKLDECNACGKKEEPRSKALDKCTLCKFVKYCSKECSIRDGDSHKKVCPYFTQIMQRKG